MAMEVNKESKFQGFVSEPLTWLAMYPGYSPISFDTWSLFSNESSM